jgi:cytochrome c biogenesis protein CcmG/thiol:disulfide interchange protein DsbE
MIIPGLENAAGSGKISTARPSKCFDMATRADLPIVSLDRLLQVALLIMFASFLMAIRKPLHDIVINAGDTAPDFNITVDGGSQVSVRNFSGKVLLLNFWATWCEPCREELPSLKALAQALGPEGLVVLGVSSDYDASAYDAYIRDKPAGFLTVRQPDGGIQAAYGTMEIPESYLIDRHGKVRAKFISNQNWTSGEIVAEVRSLL